jgi:iron(III) transport system substrate-binding protein
VVTPPQTEPFVPEDVAKHFPEEHKDPDGMFSSFRVTLCPVADNTKTVKAEEAPKSFNDLLDPKWASRMTKAHPSYSGTILTATYQVSRDIGWGYFEKLAKQKIMQVQSSTDPPKKLALGERAIMADGGEYFALQLKEKGEPIDVVYPAEGTPLIVGPNAIFKGAPNPNAARLLQSYMFSPEGQQVLIDSAGMHSVHPLTKEKPGRKSLSQIKLMKEDAAAVERESENIKKRYSQIFKV